MHVDDVLRAEDFAAEAGDAVLAELDDRQEPGLAQPRDLNGDGLRLHVDHIGRADQVADAATGAFFEFDAFDHAVSYQMPPALTRAVPLRDRRNFRLRRAPSRP